MSDATSVEVGVSDSELFDQATNETPAETPEPVAAEPEAPEPEKTEQPRDEQGKFAKTETPVAETPAEKPVVDDNGAQVPSWRVREINEEKRELAAKLASEQSDRQKLQQQFDQFRRQPPVEPPKPEAKPDPLLDPDGYEKYIERKTDERILSRERESSLRLAHRTYKDTFTEAYTAAQQAMASGDRALAARMNASADPGETLVEWHREQKTMREVGNDPNAWLERKLEERLKDPAFLAKAIEKAKGVASGNTNTQARPAVELPPSLSSSSRAGNTSTSADDSDISDSALFNYAVR